MYICKCYKLNKIYLCDRNPSPTSYIIKVVGKYFDGREYPEKMIYKKYECIFLSKKEVHRCHYDFKHLNYVGTP